MDLDADIRTCCCSAVFSDVEQVQGDLSHFLVLNFLHDLWELVRANFSLYFIVDDDHWCLTACTHATAFLECDVSIRRGLTQLDVQHLFCFFDDLGNTGYIAGCTETELNRVFAAWLLLEERIERHYAVNLAQRDI